MVTIWPSVKLMPTRMPASCVRTVAMTTGCTVPIAETITGTSARVACATPTVAAARKRGAAAATAARSRGIWTNQYQAPAAPPPRTARVRSHVKKIETRLFTGGMR